MSDKLYQDGHVARYILRIDIDHTNSPAEVNPKGTPVAAEGEKRTSASAAKTYGYCIFSSHHHALTGMLWYVTGILMYFL